MSKHRLYARVASYCLIVVAVELAISTTSMAQSELFRDDMTNAAAWGTNATSDTLATFNYNYSADGIAEAPHSRAGDATTRGVKLEANTFSGTVETLTVYPLGKNFTGSNRLRFDAWMNFDVQEVLGSAVGTTEFLGGGVGYDGLAADVASGAQLITTGDGGSASDWCAFKSPPQFFVPAANMAGGSRQNSVAYYSDFLPGAIPPASQGQPAEAGPAGAPGFQWITWEFTSINQGSNHKVSVTIEKPSGERLPIVDLDCSDTSDGSSGCTSEGNISLFYGDFFTSVSPRPDLTFGVIDNVEVSRVLSGDYNNDGVADAADYTVWRNNLGAAAGTLPNDSDGGVIGQLQYDTWKANFGDTAAGGGSGSLHAAAAPEPASVVLCGLTASCLPWFGRRWIRRKENLR